MGHANSHITVTSHNKQIRNAVQWNGCSHRTTRGWEEPKKKKSDTRPAATSMQHSRTYNKYQLIKGIAQIKRDKEKELVIVFVLQRIVFRYLNLFFSQQQIHITILCPGLVFCCTNNNFVGRFTTQLNFLFQSLFYFVFHIVWCTVSTEILSSKYLCKSLPDVVHFARQIGFVPYSHFFSRIQSH